MWHITSFPGKFLAVYVPCLSWRISHTRLITFLVSHWSASGCRGMMIGGIVFRIGLSSAHRRNVVTFMHIPLVVVPFSAPLVSYPARTPAPAYVTTASSTSKATTALVGALILLVLLYLTKLLRLIWLMIIKTKTKKAECVLLKKNNHKNRARAINFIGSAMIWRWQVQIWNLQYWSGPYNILPGN